MAVDPLDVRGHVGFLNNARRALLPVPLLDRPEPLPGEALPPFERRPAGALREKRVAVAAAAGGAASVAMVGMARAFEEAELRPAAITASSTSAIWGAMWAGGLSAGEMAALALSWRPEDHLDVQWTGLPRFVLSALGVAGLDKGRALEQLFDRHVWRMAAGETEIPFHTHARNLDRGGVERLGSETTPDLTLGELVRIAVAAPRRSEAVRVEGSFYLDAGAAGGDASDGDATAGVDHVFGPPIESEAGGFYDVFLDRRRWPELIRRGHGATVDALAPFAATGRRRRASPS